MNHDKVLVQHVVDLLEGRLIMGATINLPQSRILRRLTDLERGFADGSLRMVIGF